MAVRPSLDLGVQNIQRHRAVVENLLVKGTNVEALAERLLRPCAQTLYFASADGACQRLGRQGDGRGPPSPSPPPRRSAAARGGTRSRAVGSILANVLRCRSPARRRIPTERAPRRFSIPDRDRVPSLPRAMPHKGPTLRRTRDRRRICETAAMRSSLAGWSFENGGPAPLRVGSSPLPLRRAAAPRRR